MQQAPVWICARLENNRTKIALRFLDLTNTIYYAPRARIVMPRFERHPLLFPSYVFISITGGQYRYLLRDIPGMKSVILQGNAPAIVPPQIIHQLKKRENKQGLIDVAPRLRRGMKVQVTQGPFEQYTGLLTTDPSARVRVLFHILGAAREVSFPHSAVTAV